MSTVKRFEVTHIQRRSPVLDAWVILIFFTREVGIEEPHFYGFGDKAVPLVLRDFDFSSHNPIYELPSPHIMNSDQRVWWAEGQEIWLARKEDPIRDPAKVKLADNFVGCRKM